MTRGSRASHSLMQEAFTPLENTIANCVRRSVPTRRATALNLVAAVAAASFLAIRARADVYYYKDADGIFHMTNIPRPGAQPFLVDHSPSQPQPDDIDGNIADLDKYDSIIEKLANRFRVERALVKAIIRAGSEFNPLAVSPAGARGLMQLMPGTARSNGVRNIYDPEQNIEGGVKYLRLLLDHHGKNVPRVVAAYNAGSVIVERYHGIPPAAAIQDYVARVLRYRQQYLRRERMAHSQE